MCKSHTRLVCFVCTGVTPKRCTRWRCTNKRHSVHLDGATLSSHSKDLQVWHKRTCSRRQRVPVYEGTCSKTDASQAVILSRSSKSCSSCYFRSSDLSAVPRNDAHPRQYRQHRRLFHKEPVHKQSIPSSTLLATTKDADRTATTTSGLRVLTAHLEAPPMTETTVSVNLLETLVVFAPLALQVVGHNLRVFARLKVLLSVEEPHGDLELHRVLDNSNHALNLVVRELARTLRDVHLGLLAHHDGESATHALDRGQRDPHLATAIDVGVEDTQNVLEVGADDKRLKPQPADKHKH